MRRIIVAFCFLFALGFAAQAQNIDGYWKGSISSMGQSLEMCFDIRGSEGIITATMDVPLQGAYNIPVTLVTFSDLNLTIEIKDIGMKFKGLYMLNTISGEFEQNGMKFPLTLAKGERPQVKRPQTPVAPYPYSSENVTFENTKEHFTLAGTLSLPKGEGPFPAVVLISGSGAQNRDEELMNHKPFLVISDWLTRNGIAVLRYDDRGVGESQNGEPGATSMNLSYDAEAAFDYLLSRQEIDKSKIGLLGHSEGGIINFMVAERRSDVAFLVSLAGPAVTGYDCLRLQLRELLTAQGVPDAIINNFVKAPYAAMDIAVAQGYSPELKGVMESKLIEMGVPQKEVESTVAQYSNPWMVYFLNYDPADAVAKVSVPALLLNGTKDRQVSSKQSLTRYKEIAEKFGKTNMTIVELEGLNHLFQLCNTGSPMEYGNIEETINPTALEAIVEFIKKQ